MEYRKEIDGLRALAVTAVVLFHFDFLPIDGGFFGVDVFFVISGYLISSILFKEIDTTGTLSFSNFYLRRTRRILPALLVCCFLSYVMFAVFLGQLGVFFPRYGEAILSAIFSVSNVFYWLHSGYFVADAVVQPLLHTWSLGVEEQFYLIIPLLLFLVSQGNGNKTVKRIVILILLTFMSFALCRWGRKLGMDGDFVYYMLPTRMWELLVGSLIALLLRYKDILNANHLWLKNILAAVSTGLMVYGFFYYHQTNFIAEKALVICAGSAMFLVCANKYTFVGKFFASPVPRFVGNISYSWYLWHWPFYVLSHLLAIKYNVENEITLKLVMCAASFLVSYFSWKYVEQPFRVMKSWREVLKPLTPAFGALCLLGGLLAFGMLTDEGSLIVQDPPWDKVKRQTVESIEEKGLCRVGPDGSKLEFMLIGDSPVGCVLPGIEELADEYGIAGEAIFSHSLRPLFYLPGEEPHFPKEAKVTKYFKKYMAESDFKHVMIAFRFDSYMNRVREFTGPAPENSGKADLFFKELSTLIDVHLAKGRSVWILEQVPVFEYNPVLRARLLGNYTETLRVEKHNQVIRAVVESYNRPDVQVLSAHEYLVKDGVIDIIKDNISLYYDDNHLSVHGGLYVKEAFRPMFEYMATHQD